MTTDTVTANPGKKLHITIDGKTYSRKPLRTKRISEMDDIVDVVSGVIKKTQLHDAQRDSIGENECEPIIVVSERVVAISQGRSYRIDDIRPSWLARKLYPFVHNHPGGIGLRDPHTMQLALQEAGAPRILFAALVAVLTKPLGLKGMFYRVAGNNVNAIDGPCDYSLPPSNKSAKLAPKDPDRVCRKIEEKTGYKTVIIDANDYGVNVLGSSHGVDKKLVARAFKDNPMGQSDEQTPVVVLTC